jgi:hypothetical protein
VSAPGADWPPGWEAHRRAQLLRGLALKPAERLRWLEETMAALRRWVGRAQGPNPGPGPDGGYPGGSSSADP